MRQTLFLIPDEWLASFALPLWLVLCVIALLIQARRFGWGKEAVGMIWVFVFGAIVVGFVLPRIGINVSDPTDPSKTLAGLPIRGFGLMFLLATVAGVGLATRRARQMGVEPDEILGLAFAMFITGIIGARVYYVVQYWEQFQTDDLVTTVTRIVNTTQGGIVVYGALIGSLLAAVVTCWRRRLPILAIADLIMPAMLIGLSIGRIGCFMNGCCYGGVCDWPVAVQFPSRPVYADAGQLTPPYDKQLDTGQLIGLTTRVDVRGGDWREVLKVEGQSLGERAEIQLGDRMRRVRIAPGLYQLEIKSDAQGPSRLFEMPLLELPPRSNPVHPTQLYSSINALLLCFFLWFYYPFRYGDGEVFGMGLCLYAIARFLLELIRDDEPGQLNTELTTAQLTSLMMFILGTGLVIWSRLRRPFRALPLEKSPLSETVSPSPN